jgi:hypothetical protein
MLIPLWLYTHRPGIPEDVVKVRLGFDIVIVDCDDPLRTKFGIGPTMPTSESRHANCIVGVEA